MRMDIEAFGLNIFGYDIELGKASMYAPQMAVVNPEPIIEALDQGTAPGMPSHCVPKMSTASGSSCPTATSSMRTTASAQ
jgi:hypothetical protein